MDSLLIRIADNTAVPAGQALAVDREIFAKKVTEAIKSNQNIEVINEEVVDLEELMEEAITIVATGPLTADELAKNISKITAQDKLYFYDAAAPIVTKDSINFDIAFWGDRYEQERGKNEEIEDWKDRLKNTKDKQNYINLPMNKEEYENFYSNLINAEVVELHHFEKREIFEGCMPIEIMAKRGEDTLRFGPLKPVGFTDPRTGKRPYALVQLRQDDTEGNIFNLVGFQTNLKYSEQKSVFSMIPGLENAEFVKYGVMHRNTFIDSSHLLTNTYKMKSIKNLYFAGQITGVEGYVESISSGLMAGINAANEFYGKEEFSLPIETMTGALANYISTPNEKFQPMNANFGIVPGLEKRIKDKKEKYKVLADRALNTLNKIMQKRNDF